MNTFLPLPNLVESAEALDGVRLNQVRSHVVTILKSCSSPPPEDGKEHPAVKMWRGNELALIRLGSIYCMEHQSRGNSDATMKKIMAFKSTFEDTSAPADQMPEWFGDEAFHASHRAYLLRLKPTHYRKYWPQESDEAHLVWPRSPEKSHKSAEQKEAQKRHRLAVRARDLLTAAQERYQSACEAAGIDPETFEYIDGSEVVEIAVPDPDLIGL